MARDRGKDANLSRTTGTDAVHERNKADPDTEDMSDAREVWSDAETRPSPDRAVGSSREGHGRVADEGDLDEPQPPPYSSETQADAIARQTERRDKPEGVEKPKK